MVLMFMAIQLCILTGKVGAEAGFALLMHPLIVLIGPLLFVMILAMNGAIQQLQKEVESLKKQPGSKASDGSDN
jgi:hypothetical protein